MFSSPKRQESYEINESGTPSASTVIARGVRVEGDFKSQGDVQIEGEVSGRIETGGLLSAGPEAKLKAEVMAENAVIAGTVEGALVVKNRLELKASARVQGDISCQTIVVEGGASLNGRVNMGHEKAASPFKKTKAAEEVAA